MSEETQDPRRRWMMYDAACNGALRGDRGKELRTIAKLSAILTGMHFLTCTNMPKICREAVIYRLCFLSASIFAFLSNCCLPVLHLGTSHTPPQCIPKFSSLTVPAGMAPESKHNPSLHPKSPAKSKTLTVVRSYHLRLKGELVGIADFSVRSSAELAEQEHVWGRT